MRDIVMKQDIYWGQVPVGGLVFDQQAGPGLLAVSAQVGGVCTITLPVNNQVPLLRRSIDLISRVSVASVVNYDESVSTNTTVVVKSFQGAQVPTNTPFIFNMARIVLLLGGGVG